MLRIEFRIFDDVSMEVVREWTAPLDPARMTDRTGETYKAYGKEMAYRDGTHQASMFGGDGKHAEYSIVSGPLLGLPEDQEVGVVGKVILRPAKPTATAKSKGRVLSRL